MAVVAAEVVMVGLPPGGSGGGGLQCVAEQCPLFSLKVHPGGSGGCGVRCVGEHCPFVTLGGGVLDRDCALLGAGDRCRRSWACIPLRTSMAEPSLFDCVSGSAPEAQSLPDGAADSCDELASDRGGSKHHADNVAPSIVHAQAMLISVWT